MIGSEQGPTGEEERRDRHEILRGRIRSRGELEADGHFRKSALCVRPALPLLRESSIPVMDGGVPGECLDYGGESKWVGKPLASSLVSSVEQKCNSEVTGSRIGRVFNAIVTQIPFPPVIDGNSRGGNVGITERINAL